MTPGRNVSITTSARLAIVRATARSASACRSRTMLCLPRARNGEPGCSRRRLAPGGSTCTTSAPKSARVWLAWAPAALVEKSRTRKPARGPAGASAVRLSAFMGSWVRPVAVAIECTEISGIGRDQDLAGLGLGAPPAGVAEDLAEGLVRVSARLTGQAED